MNKRKIAKSKSKEVIQKSINYYLREMSRLHDEGYDDSTALDIENWYAAKSLVYNYLNKGEEELNKKDLLYYLGDKNRMDLVLSYYNIIKDLLDDGITLNI